MMALHRPYIRKSVRMEVENRAMKNEKGQFLDANTGKPIEGKYDLGHKYGHEFRTALKEAEEKGLTQKEFNDLQNNADHFQVENSDTNRGHAFEKKDEAEEKATEESAEKGKSEGEKSGEGESTGERTATGEGESAGESTVAGEGESAGEGGGEGGGEDGGGGMDGGAE